MTALQCLRYPRALRSHATRCQDYGSPDQYLNTLAPLLGQQAWQGATESEGAHPAREFGCGRTTPQPPA
jgi:hypothetical protein